MYNNKNKLNSIISWFLIFGKRTHNNQKRRKKKEFLFFATIEVFPKTHRIAPSLLVPFQHRYLTERDPKPIKQELLVL